MELAGILPCSQGFATDPYPIGRFSGDLEQFFPENKLLNSILKKKNSQAQWPHVAFWRYGKNCILIKADTSVLDYGVD